MRKLLLLFIAATAFAQNPAVTSLSLGNVSHSIAQVLTTYSGSPKYLRIRVIQAPGTCTGMSGGILQPSAWNANGQVLPTNPISQGVGGLSPNTTYNICPELSVDGTNWFGGVSISVTTLPLPNPHPALPIPPATFDTSYPDTTTFTTYTMNSNCLDASSGNTLLQDLNLAIANQSAHGTIINIPAGTTCVGQLLLNSIRPPDVQTFSPSAVNASTGTFTIANHGFSEGQGLKMVGCLPGSNGSVSSFSTYCETFGTGPIVPGWVYYACNVTTNTFQVCNSPVSQGGTPFTYSNSGFSVITMSVMPWPRNLHWIIVRTATPDSQFVPQGVRLQGPIVPANQSALASTAPVNWVPSSPASWLSKMATIQMPVDYTTTNALLSFDGGANGLGNIPNAYIRFVGIQFTHTPGADNGASSNVVPHGQLVSSEQYDDDIIFDRCWFHLLPPPNRVTNIFRWQGKNMAIINSYIDGMQFYHPVYVGGFTTGSGNSFTVNPFTYNWGNGKLTSSNQIAVSVIGNNGTSNQSTLIYMDTLAAPAVKIVLPPGLTGTCTAGSECNVYTGATNGVFNAVGSIPGGSGGGASGNNYWVDPIFSPNASCNGTQTLLSGDPNPGAGAFYSGNSYEVGVRFSPDTNGYVCGLRYYKSSSETGTHTGRLWQEGNTTPLASATFTGETSSGWQTVSFSSPLVVAPGNTYIVSYGANVGLLLSAKYWQNYPLDNQHLHAPAHYVNSNGSYNYNDNWPKNWLGNNSAAQLSYVTFNSGSIVGYGQADAGSQQWDTEGCQCMIGGHGPGPYIFSNNFIEASGTVWHHDDAGGNWAVRGDYTYTRNYAITPKSMMADQTGANPEWDGLEYFHRHMFEWKSGHRINFSGNVYGGAWLEDTPNGDMVEFSGGGGLGISDVNVQYNTFAHGATLLTGPFEYQGDHPGGPWIVKSEPAVRFRFQNNLVWDINGKTWCAHGFGFCSGGYSANGGWGTIFTATDDEDWTIDHNTIVGNQGQEADFLWTGEGVNEGFYFTNNFLLIPGSSSTYAGIDANTCSDLPSSHDQLSISQCYDNNQFCRYLAAGEAVWNCALTNSVLDHNVLTGVPSQSSIQSMWPNSTGQLNYVPSSPSNLGGLGWFSYNGLTSLANDYHLKGNYCSGCGQSANDGTDVGANIDAMLAAQGVVKLIGVPNSTVTTTSATVVFDVYNTADACSVDYSSTDPTLVSSFSRVNNPAGALVNNVTLSGLSSGTIYYYRVNCPTMQLIGQFRTR